MNKQEKDMRLAYRNVFGTPQGQRVLGHMLEELSFFGYSLNDEQRVNANYAKHLLDLCGLWPTKGTGRTKSRVVEVLFQGVKPTEM